MSGRKRVEFGISDAWLLQAIALAAEQRPADLREVVAAGDAINHAIFTLDEMQSGLAKLAAAGYTVEQSGRFSLSPSFSPTYARLSRRARSWTGVNEALIDFLSSQPVLEEVKSGESGPRLSQEDYELAVRQYVDGDTA